MQHKPQRFFLWIFLLLLLPACSRTVEPDAPTAQAVASAVPPSTVPRTSVPTRTASPAPANTATASPTPAPSPTPSPQPTYITLRGKVIIAQAVCHYGPGKPYLYKYGVYEGSHLELLRRVIGSNYIEVQAIGGSNPCWVREDYFEIQGDLMQLQPVDAADVKLPQSPYYAPPSGAAARREGSEVVISWNALILRAGDDSEQAPYIVEAWVCRNGEFIFDPVGSWQTSIRIVDEAGCSQASHARLLAAEKHGYTTPIEIDWPSIP